MRSTCLFMACHPCMAAPIACTCPAPALPRYSAGYRNEHHLTTSDASVCIRCIGLAMRLAESCWSHACLCNTCHHPVPVAAQPLCKQMCDLNADARNELNGITAPTGYFDPIGLAQVRSALCAFMVCFIAGTRQAACCALRELLAVLRALNRSLRRLLQSTAVVISGCAAARVHTVATCNACAACTQSAAFRRPQIDIHLAGPSTQLGAQRAGHDARADEALP